MDGENLGTDAELARGGEEEERVPLLPSGQAIPGEARRRLPATGGRLLGLLLVCGVLLLTTMHHLDFFAANATPGARSLSANPAPGANISGSAPLTIEETTTPTKVGEFVTNPYAVCDVYGHAPQPIYIGMLQSSLVGVIMTATSMLPEEFGGGGDPFHPGAVGLIYSGFNVLAGCYSTVSTLMLPLPPSFTEIDWFQAFRFKLWTAVQAPAFLSLFATLVHKGISAWFTILYPTAEEVMDEPKRTVVMVMWVLAGAGVLIPVTPLFLTDILPQTPFLVFSIVMTLLTPILLPLFPLAFTAVAMPTIGYLPVCSDADDDTSVSHLMQTVGIFVLSILAFCVSVILPLVIIGGPTVLLGYWAAKLNPPERCRQVDIMRKITIMKLSGLGAFISVAAVQDITAASLTRYDTGSPLINHKQLLQAYRARQTCAWFACSERHIAGASWMHWLSMHVELLPLFQAILHALPPVPCYDAAGVQINEAHTGLALAFAAAVALVTLPTIAVNYKIWKTDNERYLSDLQDEFVAVVERKYDVLDMEDPVFWRKKGLRPQDVTTMIKISGPPDPAAENLFEYTTGIYSLQRWVRRLLAEDGFVERDYFTVLESCVEQVCTAKEIGAELPAPDEQEEDGGREDVQQSVNPAEQNEKIMNEVRSTLEGSCVQPVDEQQIMAIFDTLTRPRAELGAPRGPYRYKFSVPLPPNCQIRKLLSEKGFLHDRRTEVARCIGLFLKAKWILQACEADALALFKMHKRPSDTVPAPDELERLDPKEARKEDLRMRARRRLCVAKQELREFEDKLSTRLKEYGLDEDEEEIRRLIADPSAWPRARLTVDLTWGPWPDEHHPRNIPVPRPREASSPAYPPAVSRGIYDESPRSPDRPRGPMVAGATLAAVSTVALYCSNSDRSLYVSKADTWLPPESSSADWFTVVALLVASAWALSFTVVVIQSTRGGLGFGWGHVLHLRDYLYLTCRTTRERRDQALEWIHVADWTPRSYRKYNDIMTKTRECTLVPFVPPENIKHDAELLSQSEAAPPSPAGRMSIPTSSGFRAGLAGSAPPPPFGTPPLSTTCGQGSDPQAADTVLWPVAPAPRGGASRLHELEKRLHDYVGLRNEVLCRRAGLSKWIHSLEDKLKELRDRGEREKTQPAEKDPAEAPAPGSGNEVSGTDKVERKIRKYEEKITNGVRRLGTREILWEFYPENRLEHDEHKGRNRGTRENTSYFYNKYQNFFQDPEVKNLLDTDCCRRADGANSVTSKVDRDCFQQVLARSPVLSLRIQCDAYHAEVKKLRAAGKSCVSASDRWRKAADEYFRNEDEAVNKEFPPECWSPRSGFMKNQRQRRKKTLTEGDRLRVAAPFRDLRTNLHWFRPGQTGTFHKYGGNTAMERGFIKITWDDLDLDDKQQQWIHPQNWVYLEQLGEYQEAHEDWALRYLANAPKATYSPGDIVTQETGPGWSMRRVYLSRSNLTEGGARHEIVRRLDAATVFTMRWWVEVTYFWLLLCFLVALGTFSPVWLSRFHVPRPVENYAPAESHHLADIVYSADKMCHQYGIVAMPVIASAVKIVVFHFTVVYFLGSASPSGLMDPDWWAGMKEHPVFRSSALKAAEEAEGKLSKERVKELNALYRCGWISKPLVGNVVAVGFATLQIVSFALVLVSVAQRIWRDEMQVATTWETYEAVLMLVCLNPSTLSLAQLLFRLRSTAEDGSLQRKYYYAGLGLLCIVGVPAFLTHAGPALVLVAGALIVFPLILPFVVVMDYTAPAVMPPGFLDTVRDDILGMLAIVGTIVIYVIVASIVYALLFWVLYIIVAAVRGTFCTLTGGESFTEVRDRILEADRNHKKWSVPAGFILRIQEESKFKGQFGWYVRNRLAGLHAEHNGRCCSTDPYVGKSPVWLFQNGRTCWLQAGIFKVAEQPNVFWALLCLLPAKFRNGLPEAGAQVGKATLASFLLQNLVVHMILWYHVETLNKVPEEFNARNFDVHTQCVLAMFWVEWHRGLQVLGCF